MSSSERRGPEFDSRSVLDVAAPDARVVVVVEKVEAVVQLVRGPLSGLAADALDDARVQIVRGDGTSLASA